MHSIGDYEIEDVHRVGDYGIKDVDIIDYWIEDVHRIGGDYGIENVNSIFY